MNTRIPSYLYKKANVNRLILFTAFFALLFVNIFEPFGSLVMYRTISEFKYFFLSSIIILDGMILIMLSRLVMLDFVKRHYITYLQYVIWVMGEIFAVSLFFALFTKFVVEEENNRNFTEIFKNSTVNGSILILLPYSILWLYFWRREKKQEIQCDLRKSTDFETSERQNITFHDEKGNLRITVPREDVLYIDSTNNFITIHYLNQSRLSHFLIRSSLTKMSDDLIDDNLLVRCHRNYIVNPDKVKVLHKNKGKITLQLEDLNVSSIPVSSLYYEEFISRFSDLS